MGRFLGSLPTDAQGVSIPELKVGVIDFGKPKGLDADGILAATAIDDTDPTVVTTFLAQPDVARGLTFTPSASADAGNILIEGTDITGNPISETVATSTTNAVVSVYAYKTVTKITFPKDDGTITWNVGWGDKLGIPLKGAVKPMALEYDDGVLQTTVGTLTVDATTLAKNMYDPHGTLDAKSAIKLVVFL